MGERSMQSRARHLLRPYDWTTRDNGQAVLMRRLRPERFLEVGSFTVLMNVAFWTRREFHCQA